MCQKINPNISLTKPLGETNRKRNGILIGFRKKLHSTQINSVRLYLGVKTPLVKQSGGSEYR